MGKIDIKDMDLFYGDFHAIKDVNLSIPIKNAKIAEIFFFSNIDFLPSKFIMLLYIIQCFTNFFNKKIHIH